MEPTPTLPEHLAALPCKAFPPVGRGQALAARLQQAREDLAALVATADQRRAAWLDLVRDTHRVQAALLEEMWRSYALVEDAMIVSETAPTRTASVDVPQNERD